MGRAARHPALIAFFALSLLLTSAGVSSARSHAPTNAIAVRGARPSLKSRLLLNFRQAKRQARSILSCRTLPKAKRLGRSLKAIAGSLGLARPKAVLLYQGAFDPVHREHLANVTSAAKSVPGAGKVLIVPTSEHPGKTPIAHRHRVAMWQRALKSVKGQLPKAVNVSVVSDPNLAKVSLDGFETLTRAIHKKHPGAAVYIMTGSDAYLSAAKQGLVDKALKWGYRYAVTPRAGYPLPKNLPAGVEVLPRQGGDVSSSAFRGNISANKGLLPSAVRSYIKAHKLYGAE